MQITFLGAARSVTGSMHLLEVNGARLLLECGLVQGRRAEADWRNRNLPVDPRSVDALILSHAHIDHSGNIPGLCAKGYAGPIYATFATRDLCRVMLEDSAHIQEQDAAYLNKKKHRQGHPLVEPLYTVEDARRALHQFVGVSYHRTFEPVPGVAATFIDAGHILGSAVLLLDVEERGRRVRLAFSGDLGRPGTPIIRDPEPVEDADVLLLESTYGNRLHTPIADAEGLLAEVVNTTAGRGGRVVIPAFSVGRTQELVYALARLRAAGHIPPLPTFVDSPLSVNATEVFRMHPECFDAETNALLLEHADPFGFSELTYVRKVEDSKAINTLQGPCIIISASGMCETGRILHHLANSITNPANTILIVGFMAEHTLGRRLVEKVPRVRFLRQEWPLRAEVRVINALSAHADRDELLTYARGTRATLKRVFLVHGEESQALPFAETLRGEGFPEVVIPTAGETYSL
ncbi:MAG: MBL fold metallo-hydrolase [Armatimonadota bacterium]|nr:MBL fold metallo-hydrolase [Armatimonadota bacterium]